MISISKFDILPDRAMELASQVGDNFKHLMPSASKWLETGAKLGVVKAGARAAGLVVRRHPVIAVATVAGAGLLWYAARRRAKRADSNAVNSHGEPIEGSARRVEAKRSTANRSTRTSTRKPSGTGSRSRTTTAANDTVDTTTH